MIIFFIGLCNMDIKLPKGSMNENNIKYFTIFRPLPSKMKFNIKKINAQKKNQQQ